jgi:hypothetical protein
MTTPNPQFVISPCVPSDIEQMISVYTRAFENNYFGLYTFPPSQIDPAEKHRWLKHRFLTSMSKPEMRNFKITDVSTGNIAAWARWGFPHAYTEEEKAKKEKEKQEIERRTEEGTYEEWPRGANLEVCDAKFGALERIRDQNVDWENTYG